MAISYSFKRTTERHRQTSPALMSDMSDDIIGADRSILEALQTKLEGRIVLPSYPDYSTDRQLSNPLFQSYPQVIVFCRGAGNDVVAALEAADRMNMAVTLRSGGHSTAGYSTGPGMIIDTSQMKSAQVSVAPPLSQSSVRVQPGCNFGELNDTLDLYRLHVPGGGCPDVCPAGYMQGGGYGFTSRPYGINLDSVGEFEMVLANGRTVVANAISNPDLFWAVRGGTGGNFGVLTSITYGLQNLDYQPGIPNSQLYGFGLRWPLSTVAERQTAAEALCIMQANYTLGTKTQNIGYMTIVVNQSDSGQKADYKPYLLMRGIIAPPFAGDPMDQITDLTATNPQIQISEWGTYNTLNYKLLATPIDIPQFPEGTKMPMENKHARYVEVMLTQQNWLDMLGIVVDNSPNPYSTLVIEPYGGAIGTVGQYDTAFVHRRASFDIFLDGFWWEDSERPAIDAFLKQWTDFMTPFWNGHVYQNYPNVDLVDYRWNYFGNAFPTLLHVKQKYDPNMFFDYPQAIKPIGAGETDLTVSKAEVLFADSPISYGAK